MKSELSIPYDPQKIEAEVQERQELMDQIAELTQRMLETAQPVSLYWKSAAYSFPRELITEKMHDLKNSELHTLLTGHQDPETKRKYSLDDDPSQIIITADEFDHSVYYSEDPQAKWTELGLVLHYPEADGNFYQVMLSLRENLAKMTGYVFSTEYMETGYEGHDFRTVFATNEQLKDFYHLLNQFPSQEREVIEE